MGDGQLRRHKHLLVLDLRRGYGRDSVRHDRLLTSFRSKEE